MKKILNDLYEGILGSLDTTDSGFSARKLSAATGIVMVCIADVKWFQSNKWEYFGEFLILHFTFILVCLGLATWQNIKTKQIEKM